MPRLLSGSTLRGGGSGDFLKLANAQPQLPATETTETGFTVATDSFLRTSYRSSLGYVQFHTATMYSLLPEGTIRILATGSTFLSTSTSSGNLVVRGGVGIGGNMHVEEDIIVNRLTIGTGYEGKNNIVFRNTQSQSITGLEDGQNSIAIGYDVLNGLITANKVIALGRRALSSGTDISNTIAIGDSALALMGTNNYPFLATITGITLVPSTSITNITTSTPIIVTSPFHNLTTGSQIMITGVNGLSTTSGGPSIVNQTSFWVDVLTTSTFRLYTNKLRTLPAIGSTTTYNGVIVTLTNYVSSGTVLSPVIVTSTNHLISTGTRVYLDGIVGTTQLNKRSFFVDRINSSTILLFNNSVLIVPENGTNHTPYASSGTIYRYVVNDNNIALGINVAPTLQNGDSNFFFGNNLVTSMVTGSNNTFIGHNVGANLTNVNGTIALGGDNLVDNKDNQVNIGSVFYYDGAGNTDINSDVRLGLGTASTGTDTGALVVIGGMAVQGAIYSHIVGNPNENFLVHSQTTSITTGTPPVYARVGDIWIDASIPAFLQYIRDGTDTYWIQIGAI
ncbi:hypothetical protein EB118_14900 [bacterium]|nr:hypothetical protein [bacterium]